MLTLDTVQPKFDQYAYLESEEVYEFLMNGLDPIEEYKRYLDYDLHLDEEQALRNKPLFRPKTKAERSAEREARFQAKIKAERKAKKAARLEDKRDPAEVLAETEAKIAAMDPERLVANSKHIAFGRGTVMSGSTGLSRLYRATAAKLAMLKGEKMNKRGPKAGGGIADGETRDRSIANARLNSHNLLKVITDLSLDTKRHLRMQTITFPYTMPLIHVVDAMDRIRDLFNRKSNEYVMVYGIGDKKNKCPTDGMLTRDRLHLHVHFFNLAKNNEVLTNIVKHVMHQDPRFRQFYRNPERPCAFDVQINNQIMDSKLIKAKGYHAAWYGSNNLKTFNSAMMQDLIDAGVYSKHVMDELDQVRAKRGFRLYMAGSEINRLLKERTTDHEIPIERNGQDAANQMALHFNKVTNLHIEKTSFCVSPDGSKFYINHDVTTEKSFRRVVAKQYEQGTVLPAAFYRAWTLHKEAGYQPSRAFMSFVDRFPDVFQELERKRIDRKFNDKSPTEYFEATDADS